MGTGQGRFIGEQTPHYRLHAHSRSDARLSNADGERAPVEDGRKNRMHSVHDDHQDAAGRDGILRPRREPVACGLRSLVWAPT